MNSRKHVRRLTTLVAAAALAAALSGIALGANLFGLRDALLPEKQSVNVTDETGAAIPDETEQCDFFSLSGYYDTPESKALAEWLEFTDDYDRDGAILSQIGNSPTGFEDEYGLYFVYTQEMADALDAIAEKYGLRLHSRMEIVMPGVLSEAAGKFHAENVTQYSGYIYEDGTFRFDGEALLPRYGTLEFQFSRSADGSFNDVTLNAGDIGDFREWGHTTPDGTAVTLGLGRHNRSLIFADLGDCFVLLNVLSGEEGDDTFSSGPIGRAELEALADSFDFSALSPVRGPDFAAILEANERYMYAPEEQPAPEEAEDELYTLTGIREDVARDFIGLLAERLEDGRSEEIAAMMAYPLHIEIVDGESFTADTPEEFLEHYDDTIGQSAKGLAMDLGWEPEPLPAGSAYVSAGYGKLLFGQVEESVLRIFSLCTDQWSVRSASLDE